MPLDRARGESSHAPVDHANGRRGRLFAGETQRAAMRLGGVWLFITLAFGILAAPLAGDTQQAGKAPGSACSPRPFLPPPSCSASSSDKDA